MSLRHVYTAAAVLLLSFCAARAGTTGAALVRHAPSLNGTVDGSLQQMDAESATLNGGATITGDWLVPGTPSVRLNGHPAFSGTIDGTGSAAPSGYEITLNGSASLRHVIDRSDPIPLPIVVAPPQPSGSVSVTISSSSQSVGDFSTLRNLTLNGNVGQYAIPPGTYGDFTANGGSGFVLGVSGSTQPVVYNFQHLTFNGSTTLQVVGPIIVNLANGFTANGNLGSAQNFSWLALNVYSGAFTLNGGCSFYGTLRAPNSFVTVNGHSQLVGGLACDRLTVNGRGLVQVATSANTPPSVALVAPQDGALFVAPASVTLSATATDAFAAISKVEFYNGATSIGEATTAPYQFTWTNVAAGSYSLTAVATDAAGESATSTPVSIVVNAPPQVSLTAPANGTIVAAPASITIQASATDSDGTVTKVQFYAGATLLGESDAAPFQFAWANVPSGTYSLTAVATDDRGATTTSTPVSVVVNALPTVALTSPQPGAYFKAPATIPLAADASDSDGAIVKVEFFEGATKIGEATSAPFQFNWAGVGAGSYSVTAVATDNLGGQATSAPLAIQVASPNNPPTISISSPVDGAIVTAPASFTLAANAADSDGSVAQVEFFQGTTSLGVVTTPPYQVSVSGLTPGSYTFSAKATDNLGATATAAPATILVNAPPTVAITAPSDGTVLPAPANVVVQANAADTDGTVVKVEFFNGTTKLGEATSAPYQFSWSNIAAGRYSITAVATDNRGAQTTSGVISLIADAPPAVSISSPVPNAVIDTPNPATITANATDSDGTVAKVEFFADGAKIGEATAAPFQFAWTNPSVGSHTLTARATDNAGITADSDAVAILINIPPVVSLTAPADGTALAAPATITFTADATDSDGTIAKVEFYQDNTKLGESDAPPYAFTASNLAAGKYVFTARATDNVGSTIVSNASTVTVDALPTVTVTGPTAGAFLQPGTPLTLSVDATDADGTVTKVEFLNGATKLGEVAAPTTPPSSYALAFPSGLPSGHYSLTARATDNSGFATVSAPVAFVVNSPPVANPVNLSTASGSPVAVTLSATDIDGTALTYALVTQPQHGTLSGTVPNLTYAAPADFGGVDTFTFTASDGQLTSPPTTVTITSGLAPRSHTYTTTADFSAGQLTGVSTAVPDQLSNTTILASYDVIWVANSTKGTVVKLDPETGRALAEYQSAPGTTASPYPSRIAIDSKGSAWVANFAADSIVKIGLPQFNGWTDRNGNNQADTSTGLGDVRPWTADSLSSATDEAILLYIHTGFSGVRQISIDAKDNVWVGAPNQGWKYYDGRTGALLRTETSVPQGGSGGFITDDGTLYSAGSQYLIWNTANSASNLPSAAAIRSNTWESARDSQGNLWCTKDGSSTVTKYSPTGALIGEYYHGEPWGLGIAIDANDNVWIAHSHCGHSVGHLLPDGTFLGNVPVANHGPTEVSIDRHGRIWVTSSTGVVERINPLGGPIGPDGQTPVGEVDLSSGNLGGGLWTYGRFTGSSHGLASSTGTWTAVFDGQVSNSTWAPVVWHGLLANDGNILVQAAVSDDGVNFSPYETLTTTHPTPGATGRYLKTFVQLVSATTGETPVLYDLTVGTAGYTPPASQPSWSVSAGAAITGNWPDRIQLAGAFQHSVDSYPTEPTYSWSMVSGPGVVTFGNPADKRSTATFSAQGNYVLRLTGTLNGAVSTSDVSVSLTPYNRAPYANAGYTTFTSSFPPQLWLWGVVRDDGLPVGATVTSQWSTLFGPGGAQATFTDPTAPQTQASFPTPGVYTLQLSATDTQYTSTNTTDVWIGVPPPPPPPSGLVSWWEASGNGDDHISGNQAFLEFGTAYASGKLGGAFSFNGTTNRVRVFGAPSLDVGTQDGMTIEFWLNPAISQTATLLEYGNNTTRGVNVHQVSGGIQVDFRDIGGTDHFLSTTSNLPLNAWTHFAATYNHATGEARLFVNGLLNNTANFGSITLATNYDVYMGERGTGTEPYKGLLDEMSIYSRALYGDEVYTIATSGKRPPVSNLPPVVSAGVNVFGQHVNTAIPLVGTISDDGQPTNGQLTSTWSLVSGPGTATFADATKPATTVTVSAPGQYILQLTANDGAFQSSATTSVLVDSYYSAPTDSSISAWWSAEGTDLDVINGTKLERINGATYKGGNVGQAFSFDGVDDHARVLPGSAIDIGSSAQGFTIEFWMNHTRSSNDMMMEWNDGTNSQMRIGSNNSSTSLICVTRDSSGNSHNTGTVTYPLNQWNHFAFSYNPATGEAACYLNGVRISVQNWGNVKIPTNGTLTIGSAANGSGFFQGQLDEISFYKRALSPADVAAIYREGSAGKPPLTDTVWPGVNVGPSSFVLPANGGTISLGGTVSETGSLANSVTSNWAVVGNNTGVSFGTQSSPSTTATFTTPGIYTLQLGANDTLNQSTGGTVDVRVGVTAALTPAGIVAWWPGNGSAHDIVNGHDATLINGTSYAAGESGLGFNFDGANNLAWVPGSSDTAIGTATNGFTIEFWLKFPAANEAGRTILQWLDKSGTARMQVGTENLNAAWFYLSALDSQGVTHASGDMGYPSGQWNHFAFTYDRTTGHLWAYVNGIRLFDTNWGNVSIPTDGTLWIASDANGNGKVTGTIDELSLYNRPLSYAEVSSIYQAGPGGKTPPGSDLPPSVNAGPDVAIPSIGTAATLNGTVSDDNKPFGTLTSLWTTDSGPAPAVFADATQAATTATFTTPGTYVLRLTASDRFAQSVSDTVTVRVGVATAQLPVGIAAWWPANGDPHEVIHGGHDVNLINSAGYTAGQVGEAFNFDGKDDLAWVTGSPDLDVGRSSQGFTIEFWLKQGSGSGSMVLQWVDASGNSQLQVTQGYSGGAFLTISGRDSTGSTHSIDTGSMPFSANQWYHFAFTYDPSTGQMFGYRNGVRLASGNWGKITIPTDGTLWFGSGPNGIQPLAGQLDEVTLYTRPLSYAEISSIYQAGAAGKAPVGNNVPPTVNAGPDLVLPSIQATATLAGTVTDDNLPFGPPLAQWTVVSGPGTVSFGNAASASTTATFTAPGLYLLKLTGTDQFAAPVSDLMEVRVGVAAVEPAAGIAAWWPGNGNPHEVVNGNHDLQIVNGVGYDVGMVGEGFTFDGTDQYAWVPGHSDLDIGSSSQGFTVEFWLKQSSTTDSALLKWIDPSGNTQLQVQSGSHFGTFLAMTGRDSTGATHGFDDGYGVHFSTNQWTHFAFTYSPASGQMVGYVNGVRQDIGTWGNLTIPTNGTLWFAGNPDGSNRLSGMLDEVTLYKRALSYQEVYATYQAGAVGKAPMDGNQPPVVSAGPDLVLGAAPAMGTLAGAVTDDNRPFGPPLANWSTVVAPTGSAVSFGTANAATTSATFGAAGTYLLQLTGSDQFSPPVSDWVEVQVGGVGATLPPNVAAWWPFNGDTRDRIHGHSASIRGGQPFAAGKVLDALTFSTNDDYATVPANSDINVGASSAGFSIEFWTRMEVISNGIPMIAWTNGTQTGVQLSVASGFGTNYVSINLTDTTGGSHSMTGPSIADQVGNWSHYVLTYDATTGNTVFYENGSAARTNNLGTGWTPQTGYDLWIAGNPSTHSFRGAMDEVTLYTRPLTAAEVSAIYNAGVDGKRPPIHNVPPTVLFGTPASETATLLNQPVTLNATAVDTDGTIAKVEYFDGTIKLGEADAADVGQPTSFTVTVAGGFSTLGRHALAAVATDNSGAATTSTVVYLNVVPVLPTVALTAPSAGTSFPANTAVTLAATASYTAGTVTKVEFFDGYSKLGESATPSGGQYTLAVSSGFTAGGHTLTVKVDASDGSSAVSTAVSILATSVPPTIGITGPLDKVNGSKATIAAGAPFTATATASDTDGAIAKVEFFNGSTSLGVATATGAANTYSLTASGLSAGTYTLTAVATDNSGLKTTSAPVTLTVASYTGSPDVVISSPSDTGRVSSPTTVTGVVAMNALTSWSLQYRLKAAEGATPDAWINLATGSSFVGTPGTNGAADTPGTLGTFDPTSLINGIYELRLTMTDAFGSTMTDGPISMIVEGNMKLGVFSLSFEDLKVPVAGIPITLTRTYDSRDVRVGDFGPGWRLALANVRLQKNTNLGLDWEQVKTGDELNTVYYLNPLRNHIVTVVMPDGQTDRFEASIYVPRNSGIVLPDNAQWAAPIQKATLVFTPIGDTTSSLTPQGDATVYFTGDMGKVVLTQGDPNEPEPVVYNPTQFRLTTKDGTVYILDEALGLLQMTDLNGNTLVVNRDAENRVTSVVSTLVPSSQTQAPTVTSVTVHRDATGRVDYIKDPAGNSLDYIYDAQGRLSSFTNRDSNVTQFFYENTGLPYYLTRIVDPRGVNAIRSEYDANGKMIKQIDANGKETDFNQGVDTTGSFEKVTDRLGNTTKFYYDDRGNVTLKIDPLGAQTTYAYYPDSDRVKLETDNYGNVKSTAYDDRGNVLVETIGASATDDPSNPTTGHTTRTTYNANSAPTQIVDPDGRTQTFTYDAKTNNLLTQTVGAGGTAPATTTFTYNTDGTPSTMTDALGNVTTYTYTYGFSDPSYPNAVKQVSVTISQPSSLNSQLVVLRTTRTLYDSQENQLAQIVTRHLPDGTAEDVITKYAYDAENRLVATILPDGRVNETRYNAIGKEDKTVAWQSVADYTAHDDTKGRVTSYGYDSNGNQTSVTYPDGTSELMHFDAENRKDWSQDRAGYRTFFGYDADGRLTSTIDPDANDYTSGSTPPTSATDSRLADNPRTKTVYDLTGRVTDSYDEVGAHTQTVYYADGTADALRRKQSIVVRAAGNLVTSYQYDGAGNVRYATDPRGNTVETQYDDQGRPTKVIYPATDENPSTNTVTQYDPLGRRIAVTDQEAKVTRYHYDGLGRLIEVRQYLDQSQAAADADYHLTASSSAVAITTYAYDEMGNQQTQTDALGRVTTFWTDDLGRRTKRTLPSDANTSAVSETLQYDGWGNLWKRTDFAGKTTTFNYDSMNRLTSKVADPTHPSLTFTNAAARIEYDYDATGARKAARTYNNAGTLLYTETTPRDERGRVQYKDTPGGQLNYTYYANNLLKDVVSSNNAGANTGYRYDEANRLESVDDLSGVPDNATSPTVQTTSFTYNANGSLETMTQPNTVVHTYKYDTLNRLRTLVVSTLPGSTATASVLHSYEYKLNPSGHRHEVIEGTKTTTYTYDALYRLTDEVIASDPNGNNGTVHYDLDKVGNRQNRNSQLSTLTSQQGLSYNSRDWLNTDTYDANGNTLKGGLSSLVSGPSSVSGTDTYDFENRLIVRTRSDGSTVNITYDADGNRIAKNLLDASGATVSSTTWLVDTNNLTGYAQVLEERVSSGASTASPTLTVYTYGNSLISQSLVSGPGSLVTRYYAFDGHGNVRELTDATGAITDHYDYDAFGNLVFKSGSTTNNYLYCGEQFDPDLGLYYLRARYLNADSGRFWSMDDFAGSTDDPPSLHRYSYCAADSVNMRDPTGQFTLAEEEEASNVSAEEDEVALPNATRLARRAAAEKIAQVYLGIGAGLTSESLGHSFIFMEYTNSPDGVYYDVNPKRKGLAQLGRLWDAGKWLDFATTSVEGVVNSAVMPKSEVSGTLIKIPGASLNFRQILEWQVVMRVLSPDVTYKFLSIPGGSTYSCYSWAFIGVTQAWIIARF